MGGGGVSCHVILLNDTHDNDTQHNDTQDKGHICDTQQKQLNFLLSAIEFYLLLC
jgi:hypothetical protein